MRDLLGAVDPDVGQLHRGAELDEQLPPLVSGGDREVLPVPASGRSVTSSIAFASRPAPATSTLASGKLAGDQRVLQVLDPYTPQYAMKTAEYAAQDPGR